VSSDLIRILAILLALLVQPLPDDSIAFRPRAGSDLSKLFEVELDLEVVLSIQQAVFLRGRLHAEAELAVTDEYTRMGDGKPLELTRSFDRLHAGWVLEDDRSGVGRYGIDVSQGSLRLLPALLYTEVEFTWNPADERYDARWHRARHGDRSIEGLFEDLDLRALLPAGPAETDGDGWDVPLGSLAPVFLPGGDLHGHDEYWDELGVYELGRELRHAFLAAFENAALSCTPDGVYEIDGRSCASVLLDFDAGHALQVEEALGFLGLADQGAELDLWIGCEGELLWDLEAGRYHSLDLEAELESRLRLPEYDVELETRGTGTWTARTR